MAGGGYRPDSVPRRAASIHLGRALPRGSSSLPGDLTHRSGMWGQAPVISLFGLAPHGVYRALSVSGEAVRSYRTLSPLPSTCSRVVYSLLHFPSRCRGRALPGMPPVAESGPSSRAFAPADARLLQPGQGYHPPPLNVRTFNDEVSGRVVDAGDRVPRQRSGYKAEVEAKSLFLNLDQRRLAIHRSKAAPRLSQQT